MQQIKIESCTLITCCPPRAPTCQRGSTRCSSSTSWSTWRRIIPRGSGTSTEPTRPSSSSPASLPPPTPSTWTRRSTPAPWRSAPRKPAALGSSFQPTGYFPIWTWTLECHQKPKIFFETYETWPFKPPLPLCMRSPKHPSLDFWLIWARAQYDFDLGVSKGENNPKWAWNKIISKTRLKMIYTSNESKTHHVWECWRKIVVSVFGFGRA